MPGYNRSFNRANGEVIEAPDFVNEYEAVSDAFDKDFGHKHDGTLHNGAYIPVISSAGGNKQVEVDGPGNKIIFSLFDGVKTAQVEIIDGAIIPTLTADIDLGSLTQQFKNIYAAGTANVSILSLTSGVSVSGILDEDNMITDSNTSLATQQSIKAYVDNAVTGGHTHDGVSGSVVNFIASDDLLNTIEVNDTTNSFVVYTDVGSVKTSQLEIDATGVMPTTDLGLALGDAANRFSEAWANSLRGGTIQLGTGGSVNSILDEDTLASNSDTALVTQQSVKAYIDTKIAADILAHTHNGAESVTLSRIQSPDTLNRVNVDDASNRIQFLLDVGSVATTKAIIDSTSLFPAADLDIDCGKSNRRYTNGYFDTVHATVGKIVRQTVPATTIGAAGDLAGMIASDGSHVYICHTDYDGVTPIWTRAALAAW